MPASLSVPSARTGFDSLNARTSTTTRKFGAGNAPPSPNLTRRQAARSGDAQLLMKLEVTSLPGKKSKFEKAECDPYFKLLVDGKQIAGGREKHLRNALNGKWDFPMKKSDLDKCTAIVCEFWYHNNNMRDEMVGTSNILGKDVANNKAQQLNVRGKDTLSVNTWMSLTIV